MPIYKCHIAEELRNELIENNHLELGNLIRRDPIVAQNALIVGEEG